MMDLEAYLEERKGMIDRALTELLPPKMNILLQSTMPFIIVWREVNGYGRS